MTDNETRPSVLYVCVHNAGRSQMAAALAEHLAALPAKALEGTKRALSDGLPHAESLAADVAQVRPAIASIGSTIIAWADELRDQADEQTQGSGGGARGGEVGHSRLRPGPLPPGRGVLVHRRLGTVPVQLARQTSATG